MTRATLLITNDQGRANLLARAERSLPAGEVIVQVKDLVGRRRACRTTPSSPRAELVANEPALVLRGGLTVLVSYYRVPADELGAVETHHEEGRLSHTYDVTLRIACRGNAAAKRSIAA
ncbi:MAG TPA: hypothetical protein VM370_03175 [Candidatus Thermoplasmatota archaeon]|nr:hypothetical protein [Candidatus Thermoplasmatota archaeon]